MPSQKTALSPPTTPTTPPGNGKRAEAQTDLTKMRGRLISLKKIRGLHPDIPSAEGRTTVRQLPFPSHLGGLVGGGPVLATHEEPHMVLAGVDAYTSAVQFGKEPHRRNVQLLTLTVPIKVITLAFWRDWPSLECCLARLDLHERVSLLNRLLKARHSSVVGRSLADLATMFDCSDRTVKHQRQATERSRPYKGGGKTPTESPA